MKWFYFFEGPIVCVVENTAGSKAQSKRVCISAQIILSKQFGLASGRLAGSNSLKRIIGAEIWAPLSLLSALLPTVIEAKDVNRGFAFSKCLNRALTWGKDSI